MINFNHLSPDMNKCQQASTIQHAKYIQALWQQFHQKPIAKLQIILEKISPLPWQNFYHRWQLIQNNTTDEAQDEQMLTDWLIHLFDLLFNHLYFDQIPTVLVRGGGEPEYFPSEHNAPARIEFAHGFFQSALHEISHWCIAGQARRKLNDFGYWYESDGRNEQTQRLFEQVEIKPQAIEALLTLACGRYFFVSQDNLNANFNTSKSTFAQDVFNQAKIYLSNPSTLPTDAQLLLWVILTLSHSNYYTTIKMR